MEDDSSSQTPSSTPTPLPTPPPGRRFSIGYALAPKKQQSFIRPSLLSLSGSRGIDLVPVDPDLPLSSQGPFDCIIHKLTGPAWKYQLGLFHSLHPSVPIIDHPDHIERLHNRISMLQFVSSLRLPSSQPLLTFGIPNQIVVESDLKSLLSSSPKVESLRFPVIAKPLVADGSAKSHKMVLVFHRDALLKLKPPIVLQEFVNHGGVIFKVYVVGDYVKCVKRKSLPDVTEEKLECKSEVGSVSFSQVSNLNVKNKKYYEMLRLQEEEEEAGMPPVDLVTDIARGLRQAMGLNLFNFDVIRDVQIGNHYLVIDINYFPGYAKMPSYESVLTDFFWDVVNKNIKAVLPLDAKDDEAGDDRHGGLGAANVEEEDGGRMLVSTNS